MTHESESEIDDGITETDTHGNTIHVTRGRVVRTPSLVRDPRQQHRPDQEQQRRERPDPRQHGPL
jgi:hypothetical protein